MSEATEPTAPIRAAHAGGAGRAGALGGLIREEGAATAAHSIPHNQGVGEQLDKDEGNASSSWAR